MFSLDVNCLVCYSEYDNAALQLIRDGADIDAVGYNGFTPLMKSAMLGNEEIARVLIEKRANINATNDNGDSALILAALNNRVNISKWLIENEADINYKGAYDQTALIIAAGQGYKEILRLLIDKGPKINAVDRNGRTALDAALGAYESEDRDEMIRLLMENGAERGDTVLYRKAASKACRLYSNLTGRWNHLIARSVSDGSLTEIGQFPWMIALGYMSSEYKVHFSCGGSLISDTFVLTAAHCVTDNRQPVLAQLGKVTLSDEGEFRAEDKNIQETIPHPKYSASTKKNDIALIRLIDRITFTKSIQPICIETLPRDEHSQMNLIVTGWGQINKRRTSTELLKIGVKTMSLAQCNEHLFSDNENRGSTAFQKGIDKSQYCAYDPSGRKDSCFEDGGGALLTTQTVSSPIKVIGIASFGIGCGSNYPSIYTRVDHYIEWIGSHVWPNGEIPTPQVSTANDDVGGRTMHIWKTK